MSDIKKLDSEVPEPSIRTEITSKDEVQPGDIFESTYCTGNRHSIYLIVGIRRDESKIDKDYVYYSYKWLCSVDPIEWQDSDNELSLREIKEYYTKIDRSLFDEGHALYIKYTTSDYDLSAFNPDVSIDDSSAIVAVGSKEYLQQMQDEATKQAKRIEAIQMFVNVKIELAKNLAQQLHTQLQAKLAVFKKQIKKIYKVIQTIELYLGISEDLVQIQEGRTTSADTPISFRQKILFMDEEVGVWEDGGLDYSNIPEFEKWLTTDRNYEKLIPEEKGMVVFKPRRLYKKYHDDRILDAEMNAWNRVTYFLIRNGENLYRIDSSNIAIRERLFPKRDELISMLKTVDETEWEHHKEEARDKFEDTFDQYRCMAFLMQGLIDRTEIFAPLPFKINIFNLEEADDAVQFIYDDELALPTGRVPFWDWHHNINKEIKEGSRILLTGNYARYAGEWVNSEDFKSRWAKSYRKYQYPPLPEKGIYEVGIRYEVESGETLPHYEIDRLARAGLLLSVETELRPVFGRKNDFQFEPKEGVTVEYFTPDIQTPDKEYIKAYRCTYKDEQLYIKYNPKDEGTHGWGDYEGKVRKNNLTWTVYRSDIFVLNYDHIAIDDIDFYIHSRTDRKEYFHLMPLLKSIKAKLLEEMKNENDFVKLMVGTVISAKMHDVSEEKADAFVRELITWWKFKAKQKRPISKDDTLAMRMIERRLKAAVNRKKLLNTED